MKARVRSRKNDLIRLPNGAVVLGWLSTAATSPQPPQPAPEPTAATSPQPPQPAREPTAQTLPLENDDYETLRYMDIIAFSSEAQSRWLTAVFAYVRSGGGYVKANDVIRVGAFSCGISTETSKRYLLKYTAPLPNAPLLLVGSIVSIRQK